MQDRVRVKSPNKVLEQKVNEASPQKLEGKTIAVFLLWGLALIISFIAFSFEVILRSFRRMSGKSLKKY